MAKRLAHILDAKWRSDDVNTKEERDFSSLHLDERILAGLSSAGFKIPSPIQLEAIPMCLTGRDVFVQGKAGTGKNLVFCILALTAILEAEDLQVLIVATTREAAFQIHHTIEIIGSEVENLKCACFTGGFSFADDIPKARECNIAVGTPGRILHLIDHKKLEVDTISLFVLDDFDDLMDQQLKPEIRALFHLLPEKMQKVVASLTCTDVVMKLASDYLQHPFLSCCNENEPSLLGMVHYFYIVPVTFLPLLSYRKKLEVLKRVLFKMKFSQCVIFCNSVHRVEPLCVDVRTWGFSVVSISKAKDQVDRLQAVELLKKNRCKVFVSTDVTSRGLDAENVDLVINFDMPSECRVYLHRCGRAGRYGAKCSSITFLLKDETKDFIKFKKEGHFKSYALPESIVGDLHCAVEPNMVASLSSTISNGFNTEEAFPASSSSTEFSKNAIINMEKTTAAEECSLITASRNRDIDVGSVDEDDSIFIPNEIKEQTANGEDVNTNHLLEKFEIIIPENECAEDCQDIAKLKPTEANLLLCDEKNLECGSKHGEQSSCQAAVEEHETKIVCNSSDSEVSEILECTALELNENLKGLEIYIESDSETTYSSSEEIDLGSTSKTVLYKAVDEINLGRGEATRKKKYVHKNTCRKKHVKSLDCGERRARSQTCTKSSSRHQSNLVDKKKGYKNHKIRSAAGKCSGRHDRFSETCSFNDQSSSFPQTKMNNAYCNCHQSHPTYCNPRPSNASSHHCYFPNNYYPASFPMHRDDMFYRQWLFINNYSYSFPYY